MTADIRTMDLNLLRAFDALMDERSVTRAASRLALTQPAVSGLLNRLRECFDDPLFVRSQRGVVPTPRALALAVPVKRVLADIDALLQPDVFDPVRAEMTVTIAASDYTLRAVIVPFIELLRQRAPGLRVRVQPVVDAQISSQLERGDVDVVLMRPESCPPGLHARHLLEDTYVCAMRTDHPEAREATMTLERFCNLDHALVSLSGDPFRGATDEALIRMGRTRRVVLSVASFLVLPEALKKSDLVAIAPRRLVEYVDGVCFMDPPVDLPGVTIVAAWHERTHRAPAHQWLRTRLVEACGVPDLAGSEAPQEQK